MRILQILPELNVGGVETGTIDFAKYLKVHRHHNVVVSNGGILVDELKKCGVKHYFVPVHKKSLWSIIKCVKDLRNIIKEERIDIVHARSRVPGWIAYFACRKTQAEFITTCHGHYGSHIFSRVMGWAKLVIVPSHVIGRHMIDSFKVPAENIRCIARSVDLNRFNVSRHDDQGKSSFTISIVGRITPLKGHVYFLKSMVKVVRSMPYVKIWIIGAAPPKKASYKNELMALVRRLGLSESVEFLGIRQDVPQLLAKTDVLVMSSIEPESFGRVILEAQAVDVPVVATKVGGIVDIIDDEETGLLVYPKDTDAMSGAVLRILNDKKFARELTVAAKKKLEKQFTVENMCENTLEVYEELLSSLHILVIKMSSLGDVILSIPAIKALRRRYPKAKIHCLAGKESRKILQRCPYVDDVIVIDSKYRDKGFWRMLKFSRKLRKYHFDKVIDFQNNFRSHLLSYLSFTRESYGFNTGKKKLGFLIGNTVKDSDNSLPPVEHQFQILSMLGISLSPDASLELCPSEKDRGDVKAMLDAEWLGESSAVVGINLSASQKWVTKNWPVEYIAQLCDILARANIRVLITGMEKDKNFAQEVISFTKTRPADFTGKTKIMELAVLIKRCKVFITPDSAPMHIAAAMHVPFIVFFGPTASSRHLPPAESCVVLEKKLECQPCYSSTCRISTHACMRDITPEEVAQHVARLIEEEV